MLDHTHPAEIRTLLTPRIWRHAFFAFSLILTKTNYENSFDEVKDVVKPWGQGQTAGILNLRYEKLFHCLQTCVAVNFDCVDK